MLVLERKQNQRIIIGDREIEILVVSANGPVKLGIRAPKEIPVHRAEVYEAIQREREA